MKTDSIVRSILLAAMILAAQGLASAQTKITYDVTALIDVADLLIIRGSEVQWHHPGSGAAVGRHSGLDEPTTISSTLDGVTNLSAFAWTPAWPELPPAQIRYDAFSSVFPNLTPALPAGGMAVSVAVLYGRGAVAVQQYPNATNDWTLIVQFADGGSGAAFLSARISVDYMPLRLVAVGPTLQARWPTNATAYQLETVRNLPASPADWIAVTNEPAVLGQDFTVTFQPSEPQRFFRLRKL